MKKLIIISTALFLVAILYSSCKGHESCPAYGAIDVEKSDKLPS